MPYHQNTGQGRHPFKTCKVQILGMKINQTGMHRNKEQMKSCELGLPSYHKCLFSSHLYKNVRLKCTKL